MRLSFQACNAAAALLCIANLAQSSPITKSLNDDLRCRYLPSDAAWPTQEDWNALNVTTNGRLMIAAPLAEVCHESSYDAVACDKLKKTWTNDAQL
jgi:hypothetical protein